jgi:glycosyltransferase involved in cell wall biosynthesis
MRVLQIHNKYLEKGGEDTVVANERQLLQAQGHAVELCEFDNLDLEGLSKPKLLQKTLFNRASYRKVIKHIEAFKPDVVHIHNVYYDASAAIFWAIKRKKVPAVMTIHNYRLGCIQGLLFRENAVCSLCLDKKTSFYGLKHRCFKESFVKSLQLTLVNKINQWTLRFANPVKTYIFLAEFTKEMLAPTLGLKNSSFEFRVLGFESPITPNSKNTEGVSDVGFVMSDVGGSLPKSQILNPKLPNGVLKSNYVSDFGFSPQSERADFYLFVGRLNEQKGVKLLVETFKKNGKRLELIGSGPLDDYVKEAAESFPNIRCLGYLKGDAIIEKLKKTKALIVPSLTYEGQPMTILEAFSTGTPVLAANTKNLDTLIAEGQNGLLFDTKNNGSLPETVALFEQTDISPMYAHARRTYEENFSPLSNYRQLMAIYDNAIGV